jgi:hypothetical protein
MKFVKMSLAAAMLMGATGAFAFEDTKVDGSASLFYVTYTDGANDAFDQYSSLGEAAINLGVTSTLAEGLTGGLRIYATDTLGLENNLVGGIWSNAMNDWWVSEAYIAKTIGNTTAKIGRQTLDTPLAFTETWGIAPNTFDAAVLVNSDIPDTTLVAAWVGKHNSSTAGWTISDGSTFATFGEEGAYAFGVVNNSYKPLTAQGWYYDLHSGYATAYWLQADFAQDGFVAGAQYAVIEPDATVAATDSSAYALKFGYDGIENLSMSVAYSATDEDGALAIANVATGAGSGAQSKLYTEAWWDFGVGMPDVEAMNFTAEYSIPDMVDLGLYATNMTSDTQGDNYDVTLVASKSFSGIDASVAYTMDDIDGSNLQVYLTASF